MQHNLYGLTVYRFMNLFPELSVKLQVFTDISSILLHEDIRNLKYFWHADWRLLIMTIMNEPTLE